MAHEFRFPDVGEGIHEGIIVKWKVKIGDNVEQDQPLADVETDKAVVELPSPVRGVIANLHAKEGETIHVGDVLVTISEDGEKVEPVKEEMTVKTEEKQILILPSVRKLAKELNLDLSRVTGTGSGGRVTEGDVRAVAGKREVVTSKAPRVTYEKYGKVLRVPFKGIRKLIAERMIQSRFTVPHVTAMDDADVTKLVKIREEQKRVAENMAIKLTYMPFILKALVPALKKHPYVNSSLDEESEEIVLKKYYNIGVAMHTPDGLKVPVIRNVNDKSIFDIAKEIQTIVMKEKERLLTPDDFRGGSFTITNYGSIGGIYGVPIINYPEVAILGVGKIHEKPVVKEGKIVVAKILPLSLSFDHRVFDGAVAAEFLNEVIRHLEDPNLLLMEMD